MAEEAIPSAAHPLRSRTPSTRLPSLAQLYAAQQLGQSLQAHSYTLPELYALEQTGAPLDLAPSPDANPQQQSQLPAPPDQPLPILADQSGTLLQPEPLTPGERLAGTARAAAQGMTGGLSDFAEAGARTLLGWQPQSIQARRSADEAFREGKARKVPSQEGATFDDHLADIGAASQRFATAYPTEEAEARVVAPLLAGVGPTGLLARILSGERLIGATAPRVAPQVVAPLARPLGPELAEEVPAAATAAAKPDPLAPPSLAQAESTPATNAVSRAETAPQTGAQLSAEPDVAYQTYLSRKDKGSGRARHIREANENYLKATENDPGLALSMSKRGIKIERTPRGKVPWRPPEGWTWHHHPHDQGLMQLMPRLQHESPQFQTLLHPFKYGGGGYAKWGDKYLHLPGAATGGTWLMQSPDGESDGGAQEQEYD
jgi:hypothetical protein